MKILLDEKNSTPPAKNFPAIKIISNHIDEIWRINLPDMTDYKVSNNKGLRFIFIIIDKFSKYNCDKPHKTRNSHKKNWVFKFSYCKKTKAC